eukprot:429274_1
MGICCGCTQNIAKENTTQVAKADQLMNNDTESTSSSTNTNIYINKDTTLSAILHAENTSYIQCYGNTHLSNNSEADQLMNNDTESTSSSDSNTRLDYIQCDGNTNLSNNSDTERIFEKIYSQQFNIGSQLKNNFSDSESDSISSTTYSRNNNNTNIQFDDNNRTISLITGYLRIYQFTDHFVISDIIKLICKHYHFNSIKLFKHEIDYNGENKYEPFQDNLNNITRFICSSRSFFFITNNNELYVKGGNNVGNLGLGHQKGTFEQQNWIKHWFFNKKHAFKFMNNCMISSHHFIQTVNNELYVIGNNDSGQCGVKVSDYQQNHTTDRCIVVPVLIDKCNFKSSVIQISSGYNHSVFLTQNGYVYQCGRRCDEDWEHRETPETEWHKITLVPSLTEIKHIDCSYGASFALNKYGKLFSWGLGSEGQLGIGDKIVRFSKVQQVYQIDDIESFSAGHSHIGYVTVKG